MKILMIIIMSIFVFAINANAEVFILNLSKSDVTKTYYILQIIKLNINEYNDFLNLQMEYEKKPELSLKYADDAKGTCSISVNKKEYSGNFEYFLLPENKKIESVIDYNRQTYTTFSGELKTSTHGYFVLTYKYFSKVDNKDSSLSGAITIKCNESLILAGVFKK